MKKLVITACLALNGCATSGLLTDTGFALVSNYKEPVTATDHKDAPKEGRACTNNILGLFAYGDGTVGTARQNGGISEVATVDKEILNILGVYGRVCTVARGR